MPNKQYNEALTVESAILKKLHRTSKLLLWAKLISFSFSAYAFYRFVSTQLTGPYGWVALAFIGLYLLSLFIDTKLQNQIRLHECVQHTLNRELAYLEGDFSELDNGESFVNPKDAYSYDLDVFGEKSLFHRINRTVSSVGKKNLANRLSHLELNTELIEERQKAIQELSTQFNWRISFLSFGVNAHYDIKQLADNLQTVKEDSFYLSPLFKILIHVSTLITIGSILLSVYDLIPVSLAGALFATQLVIALLFSKKIAAVTDEVEGLMKGLRPYQNLIEHIQNGSFQAKILVGLQEQLVSDSEMDAASAFKKLSQVLERFNQRGNLLTFILFNGLGLSDLRLLSNYLVWKKKNKYHMHRWIGVVAEFDALVSLSTYVVNHPETTYPKICTSGEVVLSAKGLYHPFLGKDAVRNDFTLHPKNFAIVTGANMAGKSTFLRSVGINFILAHNGLAVCADSFAFTPMKLFSSMRTTDNLVENISYFNAELIRLEQLMTYCQGNKHTLIILDEVLKGTNSNDKLNGSRLLLRALTKLPVSGIVATHDLELTDLAKESSIFANYCFEIELLEDIKYSYQMSEGVATNLNATFLLKKILNKLEPPAGLES